MPFPHERHDDTLKTAVGQAIMGGQRATDVVRALAAGTFEDFGEYELPVPTARYYGQQARKREAAQGLTARAKGDLDEAITQMAREILSELDHELKAARLAKRRDLEKLGTITKGLKDLRGLITPGKTTPAASKPPTKARDAFLDSIATSGPVRARNSPKAEKEKEAGPEEAPQREDERTPNTPDNTTQVPSRAADDGVYPTGTPTWALDVVSLVPVSTKGTKGA